MHSLVERLEHWASIQPDTLFCSFLDREGRDGERYTYAAFAERTRRLAEHLAREEGLQRGDRALLVYPPGLELIVAFVACTRIGVIPVPVPSPVHMSSGQAPAKLAFVARDCQASRALTSGACARLWRSAPDRAPRSPEGAGAQPPEPLEWIATDEVTGRASPGFRDDPAPTLFLQYTSGSTSDPRGVVVSHENVIENARSTLDHVPVGVSWLPQYHDMGLVGYYLFPLVMGGTIHGLSPVDFLKRPLRWLEALSRRQATYASSPNFGFEYCLREDKVPAAGLAQLDLRSLRVFMNASEPVRADTYVRFLRRFEPCGLRRDAHVVAYGLAENTLAVSHHGRRIVAVNAERLRRGALHIEVEEPGNGDQLRLVSCGRPLAGVHVRIVDPRSRAALEDGKIGEIWIAGKSTCQGYWGRPGLTADVFDNRIASDPDDGRAYLRTGDLGFLHEGELFVCGRIKDLIIVHGVNHHPQDIEATVELAVPRTSRHGVAAFEGDDAHGGMVVLVEARSPTNLPDASEIARVIRHRHGVEPRTVLVVPRRTIVRTTSGKLARRSTRERWLRGEVPVIARHVAAGEPAASDSRSAPRQRLRRILEPYRTSGRESCTFAELGVDSLTSVTLLLEIERVLVGLGASDLAARLDGRVLQWLTVAEFSALLEQCDGSDAAVAAAEEALGRIRSEHDRQERERMRDDAELELRPAAEATDSRDGRLSAVLLTGATGFFGPFLLRSLLRETPYTYHILTRALTPAEGMARIRAALRDSAVLTPDIDEALHRRVHVLCGDLARDDLGLSAGEWTHLAVAVQAIFHSAALVNYVLGYEALRPANVEGTRALLRLAAAGVRKEFHLVSSTIVFGWTDKRTLLESDDNEEMAGLDFGYAQSKWVAERLVAAAGCRGLPVRIYRPSFITASTAGVGSREDVVVRLLAFMIKHGIAVTAGNQISWLPADVAAANIAAIFARDASAARTLHVTVDDCYTIADVTEVIARDHGYRFVYRDIPGFVAELKRRCTAADPLFPLVDFLGRSQLKIAAMQHKRYDSTRYREARRRTGGLEDPPLEATVAGLMAYLRRERLVPEPPAGRRVRRMQSAADR